MYNFTKIEKKWQKFWEDNKTFKAENNSSKPPYYVLVEFPYPSGAGLHVGHVRSYTAQDAVARMKRMQGYNVLYPMGWDAFGAPAEQYAIKNHIHPKEAVKENIKTFKGQMLSLGFSFDWTREFSTTDPDYYKWTQWQFLQFYKHGMAYKATVPVNWCPNCKMVLSNEDAAGGVCERCDSQVVQKEKSQWMLKMGDYAEDLLKGLDDTNFADRVKLGQINWIGKSEGANVNFKIDEYDKEFTVFTTRCDTLYGVTYCVLSPEHKFVDEITTAEHKEEVAEYKRVCSLKNDMERTELNKEKTGVFTGAYAINPVNNKKIPIYISDYVLATYGTGAIMAVPAHDERDYEFAKKFNIPIVQVIAKSFVGTGSSKVREDKPMTERNVVNVIMKHPTEDKYVCVKKKKFDWINFVMGGIEDGETVIEAGIREFREETGYTDFTIDKELEFVYYDTFYAEHKDVNRHITCHTVVGHLNSLETEKRSKEEEDIADPVWLTKDELMNSLHTDAHRYDLQRATYGEGAYVDDGVHINSEFLDGLDKNTAINKMLEFLEENKCGGKKVNYKMRDWVFSRQRFWGEPIPMIYCEKCGWQPMNEEDLPLVLPDVAEYEPTDNGESPLAKIESFVNTTCPKCGGKAKRETDTMPNWAGSSWYFLRYMDPHNDHEFASWDAMKYWNRVDWYNGGMEHTARHLLYARFWVQFLYNIGLVPNKEMIWTRVSHGMVLGSDNQKMSKSKGNVINPDEIISDYGADVLRLYEMFMGDYTQDAPWNTDSLKGCKRFIDRVYRLKNKLNDNSGYTKELEMIQNKTIKGVTYDLERMGYNTYISKLMILTNAYEEKESISKEDYRLLLILLNPVAPHLTEELNQEMGYDLISNAVWPVCDESKMVESTKEIAVQVNGKVRGTILINIDEDEESIKDKALSQENVKKHLDGLEIVKVMVIKNKIVTIIAK